MCLSWAVNSYINNLIFLKGRAFPNSSSLVRWRSKCFCVCCQTNRLSRAYKFQYTHEIHSRISFNCRSVPIAHTTVDMTQRWIKNIMCHEGTFLVSVYIYYWIVYRQSMIDWQEHLTADLNSSRSRHWNSSIIITQFFSLTHESFLC